MHGRPSTAALSLALIALAWQGAQATDRPPTYDDFMTVTGPAQLAKAIATGKYLYLPPDTYVVDNPIVLSRTEPLYLLGADRIQTRIVARDAKKPLFVIEKAPLLNITNLQLAPSEDPSLAGARAILARNVDPTVVELQDANVSYSVLEFAGPGSYTLQGTVITPRGRVQAPILVDHPDAQLVMVGGNISNAGDPPLVPGSDLYHAWAKRGRIRIYGTGVQASLGIADFRIDSASHHGPHLIANVRSEGNGGANAGRYPSTLLRVPPSDEAVDVLLESNSGAWSHLGPGSGRLVDYDAAGTLWLLGNNADSGGRSLVTGRAPKATIVAIGNISFDNKKLLPVEATRKVAAGNLYTHRWLTGDLTDPFQRLVDAGAKLSKQPRFPEVPEIPLPAAIPRPRLTRPFPGMSNVRDFGALGDGQKDDTASVQAALDANCGKKVGKVLFFPAGTYRISRTLVYNHEDAGCRTHPPGGWIAGEGRERTRIVRSPTDGGGVFASQALAFITFQGITFETSPFAGDARDRLREATFALEHADGASPASQEVDFYDVAFVGGRYGLGIGLDSGTQCSENLMIDTEFRNAGYGLAVGSYNALANLVYGARFVDNQIAIGHVAEKKNGGTWAVLGADISGTSDKDFSLINSAAGVWYFRDLTSDSRKLVDVASSGAPFPLLFENLTLTGSPGPATPNFAFMNTPGGLIFLRSQASRTRVSLAGTANSSYAISLYSRMTGWGDAQIGPASESDELSLPSGAAAEGPR
ncbi:MAG TPA: glycosyl hydrolase family 28-related protein [Myxococcota bacterium]|nr:glycosyl hydrolase family 28-related protein [Myxococcota bacterium]